MNFDIDWARYETLITILAILVGTIILTRLTRWLLMRWMRKFSDYDGIGCSTLFSEMLMVRD